MARICRRGHQKPIKVIKGLQGRSQVGPGPEQGKMTLNLTKLTSAAAFAVVLLAGCAQQPPPAPPVATAARAAHKPIAPARLRSRPTPPGEGTQAVQAVRDQDAQQGCNYQGSLMEDHARDEDPSNLGLSSVLAGQSMPELCRNGSCRVPGWWMWVVPLEGIWCDG